MRVSGQLDASATGDAWLGDTLTQGRTPALVIFDLRGLDVVTAAGVRALAGVVQALRSRDIVSRVVVTAGSPQATVLRVVDLPRVVDVYDTLDHALAGDTRPRPRPPDTDRLPAEALSAQFTSLTQALVTDADVGVVLRRVVTAALSVVPGADLVSITLRDATGAFRTPAHSDAVAFALDEVQYRAGEGPCVEAACLPGPGCVTSADLATETRWPGFTRTAISHGLASVLSADLPPVHAPAGAGGALNVYSRKVGGLRSDGRPAALLLASHAALAIAYARTTEQAARRGDRLLRAIETRDVIGQAKGILMARGGMTADEAFDVLRQTSQELNVKLVDLAHTLVEHPDDLDVPLT